MNCTLALFVSLAIFYMSQVSIERRGYTRIIMQTMSNRVSATLEPSHNNVQLDFNYLSDSVIAQPAFKLANKSENLRSQV